MQPVCLLLKKNIKAWEAWREMKNSGACLAPVLDGERVVGFVTARDLQVVSNLSGNERTEMFEVMDTEVPVVGPQTTLFMAMSLMKERQAQCLVVMRDEQVAGFVSWLDVLNAMDKLKVIEETYK